MRHRGGRDIGEDAELLKLLQRCPVLQGLVRAYGVVGVLPLLEVGVVILDRLGNIAALVVLLTMGSLCRLDSAVEPNRLLNN